MFTTGCPFVVFDMFQCWVRFGRYMSVSRVAATTGTAIQEIPLVVRNPFMSRDQAASKTLPFTQEYGKPLLMLMPR